MWTMMGDDDDDAASCVWMKASDDERGKIRTPPIIADAVKNLVIVRLQGMEVGTLL
jgi:hypothetical protein